MNMNSVFFLDQLPTLKKIFLSSGLKAKQIFLFCDQRFRSHSLLKQWRNLKKIQFCYLRSGEKNKSLEQLPKHIKKVLSMDQNFERSGTLFISFGGGSLIDLTGFIASIYKRGAPIVHFPTTWLSALDSAHGGKTAINFQGIKNVLGTYHAPKAVFIVKKILQQNPKTLKEQSLGEVLKMGFIEGKELYKQLKKNSSHPLDLEKYLPLAIQAKIQIVKQDPFENQSIRQKLNLGHTVGHILESVCKIPHGLAVLQGLWFSLHWSFHKGFIPKSMFYEMKELIPFQTFQTKIPVSLFKKYLRHDKKHKSKCHLNFIFIKKPGVVFVKSVSEKDLLKEAKRQGLIDKKFYSSSHLS